MNKEIPDDAKRVTVAHAGKEIKVAAGWDGVGWNEVTPLSLDFFMGKKPEHRPRTQVKVAYDERAIYVAFRVEDRYVRAVAEKNQDPVCCDSCVEFFFTPGMDLTDGYFNLEINCGGTILLRHQIGPGIGGTLVTESDLERIEIYHQLPKRIDPEITDPVTWTVACALPFEILEKYCRFVRPAPGASWRANFYKCAEHTSHPHWLTWSKVDYPEPNFHLQEFFGVVKFV